MVYKTPTNCRTCQLPQIAPLARPHLFWWRNAGYTRLESVDPDRQQRNRTVDEASPFNFLFIGSIPVGERAAALMTLVSSTLRKDLDVWASVKAVLDGPLTRSTDDETLRPHVFASRADPPLLSQTTSRPGRPQEAPPRRPASPR